MTTEGVIVRMYNVGFGDAFLLTFPADDRPRRVLIDCGRHMATKGPPSLGAVVKDIVTSVRGEDGVARIDIVVATHRHQDHVSGFADAAWRDVRVGEVWMPWTEDPRDPEARRIREAQSRVARRLRAHFDRVGADRQAPAVALTDNALTNAEAMETLHRGFRGRPTKRFLPPPERPLASFESTLLPSVRIHALGPSRDADVIRDMNPPAGESYLTLLEGLSTPEDARAPFGTRWAIDPAQIRATSDLAHLGLTDKELDAIEELSSESALELAVALEKAVNGTSLMLIFELGGALLLFPGDAQWGTWQSALADREWRTLLERTTFYKVGHHGSHNGTPKDFVRDVLGGDVEPGAARQRIAAMVSTRPIKMWPEIPREPLLDALMARTSRVVRSDKLDIVPAGFVVAAKGLHVETVVPV